MKNLKKGKSQDFFLWYLKRRKTNSNNPMKQFLSIILLIIVVVSCKEEKKEPQVNVLKTEFQDILKDGYELNKPTQNISAVLVLFGGYPEKPKDIKREFKILEEAKKNGISILYMNYNRKLWMEQDEKLKLAEQLQSIFKAHKLPTNNIYFGGFSSGGNVALLISDFLTQQNLDLTPKGVFIVDSPIDLVALYQSSEKNIERNFSEISVQESTWLLQTLETQFGYPNIDISKYQEYAVYTSITDHTDNLKNLKNTKIRLYTEPDTLWWKENRMADYDQMNAYYIKRLSETLKSLEFKDVEYISTKNKGYRANGERHPHSWAIVDKTNLINWILTN